MEINAFHNVFEFFVNLFKRPNDARAVLAHFERGGRNTAGICRFARCEQHFVRKEIVGCFNGRRHVGAFSYGEAAVFDQRFRAFKVKFVLRCTRQRHVAGHFPNLFARHEFRGGLVFGVFHNAGTLDFFDFLENVEVNAVRVIDIARGIARGDDLCAERLRLFNRINRHVAGAGNHNGFAFKRIAVLFEHFIGQIHKTVAGRFGSRKRTAVGKPFAGKHAFVTAGDFLILTEQIADFSAADADVARGHVGVRADDFIKLGHKALAETHDFVITFTFGVKVGAAFAAAYRKPC